MNRGLRGRGGMHRIWSLEIGSEDTQLLPWNEILVP